jgi:hypothetical protein
MDDVALVEFHDAVVGDLSIKIGGAIRIGLTHLSVYIAESPNTYGVWSFQGTIICEEVQEAFINVAFPLDVADAIADCEILDASGRPVGVTDLFGGVDCVRLRLTWCLSSNAVACTARITVRLETKNERLDTWVGPLA